MPLMANPENLAPRDGRPGSLSVLVAAIAIATSPAGAQILSSFDPVGNQPVGVAYGADEVFVYDDFDAVIQVFDRAGTPLRTIPSPGASSNDYDLDYLDSPIVLGGVAVPGGSLLAANGDDSPDTLYALDPADGTVIASVGIGNDATVGAAYDPATGLVYSLDWDNDLVRVFDPTDGSALGSFPVAPAGSPAFSIFYGDLDIDANGNLQIVTDVVESTRVLTTMGDYVEDFDLSLISPAVNLDLTGIAFDLVRGEAWVTSRGGRVYQIAGFPRIPEPAAMALLLPGLVLGLARRR